MLTEELAYKAMVRFINDYYIRDGRQSKDIEIMLGGMGIRSDGHSGDPAMLEYYKEAIKREKRESHL